MLQGRWRPPASIGMAGSSWLTIDDNQVAALSEINAPRNRADIIAAWMSAN